MLQKIKQILLEEYHNWVLWLPVLFGVGIVLYFELPFEPSSASAAKLLTASVILFILVRRQILAKYLCIGLIVICAGFAATKFKADYMDTKFISTNNQPVTISGNIVEIGYSNDFPRLTLSNLRIDELGTNLPQKIKLNVRTKIRDKISVGDRVITDAVLMPPPSAVVVGGYDYAKSAYFEGVGATGYTVKQVIKLKQGHQTSWLQRVRQDIGNKIYAVLEGDKGAIAAALINGDRSKISNLVNSDFRNSGLYHMLSISGLHLVLVTGVFFISSRFLLSLSYHVSEVVPIKKIAAFIALLGGLFYLLISGLQVPAERAYIMAGLILIGIIFDRTATPLRSVAVAAMVVLIFEPNALITPSFQMSFAAAAALIAVYEYISRHHPNFYKKRLISWLAGVLLTSLIAGLATTPYAAFHFGRLTNYGLIANMLAMPITTFLVMPAAVFGVLLMPFGLEEIALIPMGWGVGIIMEIAEYVGSLRGATASVPYIPELAIVIFTMGFLWLILWQHRWRLLGIPVIITSILIPIVYLKPDIMINETGKIYALNNNGRLEFNNIKQSFTSKSWLQFFGQEQPFEITTHNVKNCHFYGKKLQISCNGKKQVLPKNSIVYLPNKIVPINPKIKRVWTKHEK